MHLTPSLLTNTFIYTHTHTEHTRGARNRNARWIVTNKVILKEDCICTIVDNTKNRKASK